MAVRPRKRGQGAKAPAGRAGQAKASVGELCVREVETVAPDVLAKEAARRMDERAVGTLVVVDELGRPLGIVTDRDLMVRCIAGGADRSAPTSGA